MGQSESRDWFIENVLLLDPHAPPFGASGPRSDKGDDSSDSSDNSSTRRRGGKTAKLMVPGNLRLNVRSYDVILEFRGHKLPRMLKCMLDPPGLQFTDSGGLGGDDVPLSRLQEGVLSRAERILTVRSGDVDRSEFKIIFKNPAECNEFCQALRGLFGVLVLQRGAENPMHQKGGPKEQEEEEEPDEEEPLLSGEGAGDATRTYPIAIAGPGDVGGRLWCRDLNPVAKPPQVFEWFVSTIPGRDPQWGRKPTGNEPNFIPRDEHVGCHFRLRVVRRGDGGPAASTAIRGPVEVSTQTAKAMLRLLNQPNVQFRCDLPAEDAVGVPSTGGYVEAKLLVARTGLVFKFEGSETKHPWPAVGVSRPPPSRDETDRYLYVNKADGGFYRAALATVQERNEVYHTCVFYKLSKSFQLFDKWAADLDSGNFDVIKKRYASLWAKSAPEDSQRIE